MYYVLDGHTPVSASVKEWARWRSKGRKGQDSPNRVAQTTLPDGRWVSTVFLGLDHRFSGEGPPLLFETMVFASRDDLNEDICERWATWASCRGPAGYASFDQPQIGGIETTHTFTNFCELTPVVPLAPT